MAVEKQCPQCGKSHKVKRITKIYCSAKCRDIAAYAKKLAKPQEQQRETKPQFNNGESK